MDFAKEFVCGSFAGMAQVLASQPLDTVKVRMQVAAPGRFTGPWDCLRHTVRNEGFWALYKGTAAPLAGIGLVNALLFVAYGRCKSWFANSRSDSAAPLPLHEIAISGAIAGPISALLASPIELIKIQMQAQYGTAKRSGVGKIKGPIQCAQDLIRYHGVQNGLFRGFWITFLREIPAYAAFYSSFEATKRALQVDKSSSITNVSKLMVSGSVGGIAYWLACYPLDVVKSRIQAQKVLLDDGTVAPVHYRGVVSSFAKIAREEGLASFWRGLSPTILRALPAASATFTVYELSSGWLDSLTTPR